MNKRNKKNTSLLKNLSSLTHIAHLLDNASLEAEEKQRLSCPSWALEW
jgi:hypothetical protein